MLETNPSSPQSSFLRGISRLVDFGGLFSRPAPFKDSDEEALREDWRVIGQDLHNAIKAYDAYRKKSRKRTSATN